MDSDGWASSLEFPTSFAKCRTEPVGPGYLLGPETGEEKIRDEEEKKNILKNKKIKTRRVQKNSTTSHFSWANPGHRLG